MRSVQQSTMRKTIDLPILFRNKHFLVINKPPLVLSQQGSTARHVKTVLDYMLDQYPELFNTKELKDPFCAPKLVHRLDFQVSGAMALATSALGAKRLSTGLTSSVKGWPMKKEYLAVLEGTQQKILRCADNRYISWKSKNSGAISNILQGKECITEFEILKSKEASALCRFSPITGRKHQIRQHASRILGVPILGDTNTGKDVFPRPIALHSAVLTIDRHTEKHRIVAPLNFNHDLFHGYEKEIDRILEGNA